MTDYKSLRKGTFTLSNEDVGFNTHVYPIPVYDGANQDLSYLGDFGKSHLRVNAKGTPDAKITVNFFGGVDEHGTRMGLHMLPDIILDENGLYDSILPIKYRNADIRFELKDIDGEKPRRVEIAFEFLDKN